MIIMLRKRLKRVFDRIPNERIKNNFFQAIPFWVASLLTGLVAVLFAKLFVFAESGASFILHHNQWWLYLVTPVCFVVAWWLATRFAPYARGSGIPQVMASIELATPRFIEKVKSMLSVRIIIVKMMSSLVMIA